MTDEDEDDNDGYHPTPLPMGHRPMPFNVEDIPHEIHPMAPTIAGDLNALYRKYGEEHGLLEEEMDQIIGKIIEHKKTKKSEEGK